MKHLIRTVLYVLPLALAAQTPTFRLTEGFLQKKDFEGTIEYAKTAVISFEAKGRLAYVASPGQYVQCSVFDKNGELVKKGDLLARQDTDIPTSDVEIAQAELDRSRAVLKDKMLNLDRDAKLNRKEAVSARQYQETQMLYDTAVIDSRKAELSLRRAQQVLDACYIWAPFNAIVEEVCRSEGGAVDVGHPVMKLSMIDPVRLQLKLSPEMAEQLPQTTQVLVYPRNSKDPVPAWFSIQNLSAENLICYVANPRISDTVRTPSGKKIPTFDRLTTVLSLPEKKVLAPLWILDEAIQQDKDGSYVWRLTGVPNSSFGNLIPSITRLEKVRVETSELYLQYGTSIRQGIKAGSKLKEGDILAADVPSTVTDDGLSAYSRKHHRFQIGEKVRVVLFTGNSDHVFHVPPGAIRTEGEENYVLVKQGRDQRKVPVSLLRRVDSYLQIFSDKLAPGQELILKQ